MAVWVCRVRSLKLFSCPYQYNYTKKVQQRAGKMSLEARTRIRLTPSASSPPNFESSGASFPSSSLSSSAILASASLSSSSSSSSLSSATFPLLFFRAFFRRVASEFWSRKAEKPTVPPVLRGAMLEKSSCPERRFADPGAAGGFLDELRTPIFCSCPEYQVSLCSERF